jgi:hypothetical protein
MAAVNGTANRRHCLASLRYGIKVETPREFLSTLKTGAAKPLPRSTS